jgi:hypothetical protein
MKTLARLLLLLCLIAPMSLAGCGGGATDIESTPEEDPALSDDEASNPSAD